MEFDKNTTKLDEDLFKISLIFTEKSFFHETSSDK